MPETKTKEGAMPDEETSPETATETNTTEAATETATEATVETEPELGDAGKKAIAAERVRAKAAEKRATAAEKALADAQSAQMSEQERAVEAARNEGRAEVSEKTTRRLFAAEVKAAAAGKIQDPDLLGDADIAQRLLGLTEIPVDDAGDIDTEAISVALAALVAAKPYLAAPAGTQRPTGNANGGAMTATKAASRDERLAEAMKNGDSRTAISITNERLAELHAQQ